jgi:GTP-dependent dephospho-CoA kinase
MKIIYAITPELRIKLKEPFGHLITGTFSETTAKLKELLEKEKPPLIISVGDVVSKNLHQNAIHPQITIIDFISLRDQVTVPPEAHGEETVNVRNPQGTITEEAVVAIQEALAKAGHTHIVVEGEEDLLTLIAVLYAPENAYVIYGQPYSGIVVVKVTFEKKGQVQEFLNTMKPLEKLNKKKTV